MARIRMIAARFATTVATVSLLAACESAGRNRDAAQGVAVRDSAGITIVENTEADPPGIVRWSVDSTPSRTIGVSMGDSAYEFGQIGGVRELPNGMIVVLNGQGESAFELRFYDSTGTHIVTHGRRGQGPGEYRWINYFGSAGGDTVIAVDFPNSRLNWVSASAGFVRSSRLVETGFKRLLGDDAFGLVETMVPLGDSLYAIKAFRRMPDATERGRRSTSYHLVDLAADTALDLRRYDDPPLKMLELSIGPVGVRPLDSGEPVHVVDRDRRRICAGTTSVAVIECVDADGRRRIIRWATQRVPYTDEDRRDFEESVRARWSRRRGSTAAEPAAIIAATDRPVRHNPFSTLQIDTDGNYWILEPVLDSAGSRGERFRVLDADGRHIAFADPFPARSIGLGRPLHIGATSVLRVIQDADDVSMVGVFRIRKPD